MTSLDAFRGLTMLTMLVVNNTAFGIFTPRQLMHAAWNTGVTLADLVFPWFLLIVGMSIPFSSTSRDRGWRVIGRIAKRAGLLLLLGILVDTSVARQPMVGLGVLQLIGLVYFFGALLVRTPRSFRAALAGVFLIAHWAAIRFYPVPGLGVGIFQEQANLISYLNTTYLLPLHLKGILSLIPTTALVLIGTLAGEVVRRELVPSRRKALLLLGFGGALALVGWVWNLDLPFNKPVWSASYILFGAGSGLAIFSLFYLLVDVPHRRGWVFPLVVLGSNAIVAYVLPILAKVSFLKVWQWPTAGAPISVLDAYVRYLTSTFGQISGGLLYMGSYILVWWMVLYYLYRKRIFLRA